MSWQLSEARNWKKPEQMLGKRFYDYVRLTHEVALRQRSNWETRNDPRHGHYRQRGSFLVHAAERAEVSWSRPKSCAQSILFRIFDLYSIEKQLTWGLSQTSSLHRSSYSLWYLAFSSSSLTIDGMCLFLVYSTISGFCEAGSSEETESARTYLETLSANRFDGLISVFPAQRWTMVYFWLPPGSEEEASQTGQEAGYLHSGGRSLTLAKWIFFHHQNILNSPPVFTQRRKGKHWKWASTGGVQNQRTGKEKLLGLIALLFQVDFILPL